MLSSQEISKKNNEQESKKISRAKSFQNRLKPIQTHNPKKKHHGVLITDQNVNLDNFNDEDALKVFVLNKTIVKLIDDASQVLDGIFCAEQHFIKLNDLIHSILEQIDTFKELPADSDEINILRIKLALILAILQNDKQYSSYLPVLTSKQHLDELILLMNVSQKLIAKCKINNEAVAKLYNKFLKINTKNLFSDTHNLNAMEVNSIKNQHLPKLSNHPKSFWQSPMKLACMGIYSGAFLYSVFNYGVEVALSHGSGNLLASLLFYYGDRYLAGNFADHENHHSNKEVRYGFGFRNS